MAILDALPETVRIVEVGPRDGLQNEPHILPAAAKVAFIEALADAGHRHIEVTSLVRPDRVPQLADAEEVLRSIRPREGVVYTALVPNEKGLERALAAGARSVAVFTAASETFSRRNTGTSVADSLEQVRRIAAVCRRERIRLRGYISTAFVCPHEGEIAPDVVVDIARRLEERGIENVSIGDTLGVAHPASVDRLLDALARKRRPPEGSASPLDGVALHLHDTHQRALANALVGLQYGVVEFDGSAGGLGGCPFAPGARGNLDTEVLVRMLESMGISTGIDLEKHRHAVELLRQHLGRERNA